MSRLDETIQAKLEKKAQLLAKQVEPYAYSFAKQHSVAVCRDSMDQTVITAGRLMTFRLHGKVVFADLQDDSAKIQLMFRHQEIGDEAFDQLKLIDAGDFIGVTGQVMTTKAGETTILVRNYTFLSKALRPLPSQWNAAESKEARFRQRYLDMLINPEVKQTLDTRWLINQEIRRFLQDTEQFTEVETPVFHPLYGGTNAKPFTTHMNALDTDFYLRLAPELYLKRLIVGGYERIFEIARNFRNEGIDQTHQPEFSMIEWYEAYADYHRMMKVCENLLKHLCQTVHGQLTLQVQDTQVDLTGDWPKVTMVEAIKAHLDLEFDQLSDQQVQQYLDTKDIGLIGEFTRGKALFAIFDKLVPEFLIQPTWIIDYPRDVSPLSKIHRHDSTLAERFELYIGGKELADGWSEITDPVDQRQIFENEQTRMRAGDDEAHPIDEDFLAAMEYGMPPLGGIGMGIDRLVMFITNTWSIREVIAFPTLKPLSTNQQKQADATTNNGDQTLNPPVAKANNGKQIQEDNITTQVATLPSSPTPQTPLPPRSQAEDLLNKYIENDNLKHHCRMVAEAMAAYAQQLGADQELWYQTGLLHDLDWEKYPDEHPTKAIKKILTEYPQELLDAIAAHAPERTGKKPETQLERYLFACDELSGFMHAVALMRPGGFADMKVKSIKKKLKDKSFAAAVSREDIYQGAQLIDQSLEEHIQFLIAVFKK